MKYEKAFELITLPSAPLIEHWEKQILFFKTLTGEFKKGKFNIEEKSDQLCIVRFMAREIRLSLIPPDTEGVYCKIQVSEHIPNTDPVGTFRERTHWYYVRTGQGISKQDIEEGAQLLRKVQEINFPIYLAHDIYSFLGVKVPQVTDLVFHATHGGG